MKSRPVWSFKLAKERCVGARRPVLSDKHVLVAFHYDKASFFQSKLLAFDPLSGKEAWSYVVDHVVNEPVSDGSTVYWSSFGGSVHALDAQDGRLLWLGPGCGLNIGIPVVCGDRVVVGEIHGCSRSTWCLDRASGKTLWKFEHGGITSPMVVADQRVFFSAIAHTLIDEPSQFSLYALSLENGKALWSVTDTHAFGNLIVMKNRLYIFSSSRFQVRDAKTGKLLSELLPEQNASLRLAPGSDATRFHVWDGVDTVTAIDVRRSKGFLGEKISLSVAWQKQEARGLCAAPQMLAGNTLAYLTHDSKLCFIDPASGAPIQEENLGTKPSTFGGMAAAHGHLFISHGRNLLALPHPQS